MADCFTSIIGGFAVFSILGFMSHVNKIPIDQLVEAGTGLAFVNYNKSNIIKNKPISISVSLFFRSFILKH